MQWPATNVTLALPLITTLLAVSALLLMILTLPALMVWSGNLGGVRALRRQGGRQQVAGAEPERRSYQDLRHPS